MDACSCDGTRLEETFAVLTCAPRDASQTLLLVGCLLGQLEPRQHLGGEPAPLVEGGDHLGPRAQRELREALWRSCQVEH